MKRKRVDGFTLVESLVGISLGTLFIAMFAQIYIYTSNAVAESRIEAAVTHIANNNLAKHLSVEGLKREGLQCNINIQPASGFEIDKTQNARDAISSGSVVIVSQKITAWAPRGCNGYFAVHSTVEYKDHPQAPTKFINQMAYAKP